MSATDIWMPIYIGDYLADTMHLNAQEHGAYLLLLMHYWRSGPLPDDDRQLASIARVERKVWQNEIAAIIRPYFEVRDGRLHQGRIDIEREAAVQNREQKKAAAQARWGGQGVRKRPKPDPDGNAGGSSTEGSSGDAEGHSSGDASAYASGYADAQSDEPGPHIRTQCPSPSPLPSSLRSEDSASLRSAGAAAALPVAEPDDPRTQLFRSGLAALIRLTGQPEPRARTQIGRWLKIARDDAALVLLALHSAEDARPASAIPWIEKSIAARCGTIAPAEHPPPMSRAARMRERLGVRTQDLGIDRDGNPSQLRLP
jgi:uncharacterized protein YdaU (DUF1376 family)